MGDVQRRILRSLHVCIVGNKLHHPRIAPLLPLHGHPDEAASGDVMSKNNFLNAISALAILRPSHRFSKAVTQKKILKPRPPHRVTQARYLSFTMANPSRTVAIPKTVRFERACSNCNAKDPPNIRTSSFTPLAHPTGKRSVSLSRSSASSMKPTKSTSARTSKRKTGSSASTVRLSVSHVLQSLRRSTS